MGITQVRVNLTFRDKDCVESGFHTDKDKGKTAILYLTTCNGKTVFKKNNEEISLDNIDNRIVIFDSNIQHKAIYQTDVHRRILINFNYYC